MARCVSWRRDENSPCKACLYSMPKQSKGSQVPVRPFVSSHEWNLAINFGAIASTSERTPYHEMTELDWHFSFFDFFSQEITNRYKLHWEAITFYLSRILFGLMHIICIEIEEKNLNSSFLPGWPIRYLDICFSSNIDTYLDVSFWPPASLTGP